MAAEEDGEEPQYVEQQGDHRAEMMAGSGRQINHFRGGRSFGERQVDIGRHGTIVPCPIPDPVPGRPRPNIRTLRVLPSEASYSPLHDVWGVRGADHRPRSACRDGPDECDGPIRATRPVTQIL